MCGGVCQEVRDVVVFALVAIVVMAFAVDAFVLLLIGFVVSDISLHAKARVATKRRAF